MWPEAFKNQFDGVTMVERLKTQVHILDSIPGAFLLTDTHSKILYANQRAARLFGFEREEIEGKRIRLFFLDEDLIYFLPNIMYLTLYQKGFEGEILLKRKDGEKVFVNLATSLFREEGDSFLSFSFKEIQLQKSLERERAEWERWACIGKVIQEVAHQIRSPIASIGGFVRRLVRSKAPVTGKEPGLEQILRETRRLEATITRLEEYLRISRPQFRREQMLDLAEEAIGLHAREARRKRIAFDLISAELNGNGECFADRGLVVKALSHLLKNSLKAVEAAVTNGGRRIIRVVLFRDQDRVGIVVSDSGMGISKRHLGQIFDPFFSTHPRQIGLGLTFVRRVMEEHGGRIEVESRLRKGTTVTLFFPRDRRRSIRRGLVFSDLSDRLEG